MFYSVKQLLLNSEEPEKQHGSEEGKKLMFGCPPEMLTRPRNNRTIGKKIIVFKGLLGTESQEQGFSDRFVARNPESQRVSTDTSHFD